MAILNIVGQLGPLIGTRLYPDEDAPYYVTGMAVCAGFMVGVAILAIMLRVVLARRNSRTTVTGQDVELDLREGLMERDGEENENEYRNGKIRRKEEDARETITYLL